MSERIYIGSAFPRGSFFAYGELRAPTPYGMAVNHTPILLYGEDQKSLTRFKDFVILLLNKIKRIILNERDYKIWSNLTIGELEDINLDYTIVPNDNTNDTTEKTEENNTKAKYTHLSEKTWSKVEDINTVFELSKSKKLYQRNLDKLVYNGEEIRIYITDFENLWKRFSKAVSWVDPLKLSLKERETNSSKIERKERNKIHHCIKEGLFSADYSAIFYNPEILKNKKLKNTLINFLNNKINKLNISGKLKIKIEPEILNINNTILFKNENSIHITETDNGLFKIVTKAEENKNNTMKKR
ncbi:hypothetical protein H8356DRAFT_1421389 [Neocallimastix lanati (nom. inval.)]|nr:hypothetical protein H8356DRAFT_1421389 [Neocallimastix sp. JGI-2020a]